MKKIVLTGMFAAFIAASSLPAAAANHVRKTDRNAAATTEQVRNARASMVSPQSDLSYGFASGNAISAPAGR